MSHLLKATCFLSAPLRVSPVRWFEYLGGGVSGFKRGFSSVQSSWSTARASPVNGWELGSYKYEAGEEHCVSELHSLFVFFSLQNFSVSLTVNSVWYRISATGCVHDVSQICKNYFKRLHNSSWLFIAWTSFKELIHSQQIRNMFLPNSQTRQGRNFSQPFAFLICHLLTVCINVYNTKWKQEKNMNKC